MITLQAHGVSGGEVRDEEIGDGPVLSGSGSAGAGGSAGTDGGGRVFAMACGQGVLVGLGGGGREPGAAAEHLDAGCGRWGR